MLLERLPKQCNHPIQGRTPAGASRATAAQTAACWKTLPAPCGSATIAGIKANTYPALGPGGSDAIKNSYSTRGGDSGCAPAGPTSSSESSRAIAAPASRAQPSS